MDLLAEHSPCRTMDPTAADHGFLLLCSLRGGSEPGSGCRHSHQPPDFLSVSCQAIRQLLSQ